jgi:hypothetical protein
LRLRFGELSLCVSDSTSQLSKASVGLCGVLLIGGLQFGDAIDDRDTLRVDALTVRYFKLLGGW